MSRADQVSVKANFLLPSLLSSSLPASSSCLFGLEVRSGLINGLQEASSAGAGKDKQGSRRRQEAGEGTGTSRKRRRRWCERALSYYSCSEALVHVLLTALHLLTAASPSRTLVCPSQEHLHSLPQIAQRRRPKQGCGEALPKRWQSMVTEWGRPQGPARVSLPHGPTVCKGTGTGVVQELVLKAVSTLFSLKLHVYLE